MAFERPTLTEIVDRTSTDINSRVAGGQGAALRRSVLGVLARVLAGAVHLLYGYLDWLARQLMPDTAEAEHLARWASVWGVARRAGIYASGLVGFTGADGSTVPAGTELQAADGTLYTTAADATISSGVALATVTAAAPGAAGNVEAGVSLSLVTPISGVDSTAVTNGITGGLDDEDDDSLRERLLARIQQPPHGGAAFDYEAWAREVAGVGNVWVSPGEMGAGTVTVRFVTEDPDNLIPDAQLVDDVQAHIDGQRPVTAEVYVVAPVAVPLDFTIQLTPNTQAVRDAVQAELVDLLQREAEPGGTILLSHIREAISVAAGETDHVLVAPAANVAHGAGEIAVMGAITWQ